MGQASMNVSPGMQDDHALDEASGADDNARCLGLEPVDGEVLFFQAKITCEPLGPQLMGKICGFLISATYNHPPLFTSHVEGEVLCQRHYPLSQIC